jgi:hypothetical protein
LVLVNPLLFDPGDRLTREEFLSRWEQMPDLKFAELIDGTVYMPSPLSYDHGHRDGLIQTLLGFYAARTGVCESVSNATWLMLNSAPQPDVALRLLPQYGGKTDTSGKLASGAPELIVEVCRSSHSFDLGPKLALYQRAGVGEYVAALLEEQRIEWRALESGSYRLLRAEGGIFKSAVFPGLWLDETAFWAGDARRMLEVLEEGMRSPEHKLFIDSIRHR